MAHLKISLLGVFAVTLDGEPVTGFDSAKVRALLAYLAVEADRPHSRETLAGLLWPDWPDRSARTNLRNTLANLRATIGDWEADPPTLLVTRQTIQFNAASDAWLDVTAFTDLTGLRDPSGLEEAVALYRGPFLEGFSVGDSAAFEDWALRVREQLERRVLAALESLSAHYEAQGQIEQACALARRQVDLAPWQEEGHRRLMRLLALSGQRSAALAQYEACRRALIEELDVEPSGETVALYERICDGEAMSGFPQPDMAVQPVGTPPRSNLPVQLTPFVGREELLAQIGERLADPACRLLTLVGPGGSGKTRLAVEAAARRLDSYSHGVFFVSLAPLDAVESIVPTVAQALGLSFHGEGEPKAQLLAYLREKRMLLILDNYEHLLEGATLATEILQAAPQVVILATSRARLSVRGEVCFPVEGMDVPPLPSRVPSTALPGRDSTDAVHLGGEGEYSAVKLFLDGARRAQPDFELTDENMADVVRTCRLVEGMPLGILLAAAWVGMLPPAKIAAEISRTLDFLESGERDAPARQRSLRAVFDHSWKLLSERERTIFAALSVFRGGFTGEAAEQVAGASLRELLALADKSLLHRTASERYELHEMLRQYAGEKLALVPDAGQQVRDRHCTFYAAALQQWDAALKGPRQLAALTEIEVDLSNVRAAWEWAIERGYVRELDRAVDGLCRFYDWRGRYEEGDAACRAAADALAAQTDVASPPFAGGDPAAGGRRCCTETRPGAGSGGDGQRAADRVVPSSFE